MEALQQHEWQELQARTWQLLRGREHILRSKHCPLLQYLVRPSFSDTWCIDFVRTGDELAAFHTVWRTTEDINVFSSAIERLKHPRPYVPTLASTRINVGNGPIESVLRRLAGIEIPLTKTRDWITLDGVSFELQIGDGTSGILMQWHNRLPDEWPAELRAVVNELDSLASQTAGQAV